MKAVLYQDSFNFIRPNSCKEGRTHGEILKEDRHWISTEVLRLPPIFLDEESKDSFLANFNYRVGHHLPVYPQVNGDLHLTKTGIPLYLQFLNRGYKLP
jgi:hypothetical protein